jgi:drug/metabolite transporter (DMT)-like permease
VAPQQRRRAGGASPLGERPSSLRADLGLLAVSAIWGFTFPAIQLALRDVRPITFVAYRFVLAALVLALVFRGRALRVSWQGLGAGVALGLCLAAGALLQTFGLAYTTAPKSAFITALYVVLVPLLAMIVQRVQLRVSSLGAVGLAAVGLYLITMPNVTGLNLGDLLTMGCAVAFGVHILIAESVTPRNDPIALAFWQVVTTAAVSAAAILGVSHLGDLRYHITPWSLTALLVAAVPATAFAFGVQMWAQRETSATHAAVILTGEPVFAALLSWLILRQVMRWPGLLGAALILAGVLLAQVGARPRASCT